MTRLEKRTRLIRSIASLLVLMIFLVFGCCPLRNALCSLVHPIPQKTAQKAPEHAKAIAPNDYVTATFNKIIPFHEHSLSGNPSIFIAVLVTTFLQEAVF